MFNSMPLLTALLVVDRCHSGFIHLCASFTYNYCMLMINNNIKYYKVLCANKKAMCLTTMYA